MWRLHRPYLVNLAYQMLGDVGDAEDVAQEAFLRSARARFERPDDIGSEAVAVNQPARPNPADRVPLDDEVREALRRLSPGERVQKPAPRLVGQFALPRRDHR